MDDFVNVSGAPNFGVGDFTVEFWVKFNSLEGEQVLVEKYVETFGADARGWTISKLENNTIIPGDIGPVAANTWMHVAIGRSSGMGFAFLNGDLISTFPLNANLDSLSSLKFGHRGSPSDTPDSQDTRGFFLNGMLDEVTIYNRALSAAEVQSIYAAGSAANALRVHGWIVMATAFPTVATIAQARRIPTRRIQTAMGKEMSVIRLRRRVTSFPMGSWLGAA